MKFFEKVYYNDYRCIYIKIYLLIDKFPRSIYSDILLYSLYDSLLDKIKDNKINMHVKSLKIGSSRYAVIEFIFNKEKWPDFKTNLEKIKITLDNISEKIFQNIETYIEKSLFSIKKLKDNNFSHIKLLSDDLLYPSKYKNNFDLNLLKLYIKEFLEKKGYLFLILPKEYKNFSFFHKTNMKNFITPSKTLYKKKFIKIYKKNGNNIMLWISPLNCSPFLGSILALFLGMKIHEEVREKRGLAYYAGCIYDKFEKSISILISTNLKDNILIIENILNNMFTQIINKGISKVDIQKCILHRKNDELSILDEPISFLSYQFELELLNSIKKDSIVDQTGEYNINISAVITYIKKMTWKNKIYIVIDN